MKKLYFLLILISFSKAVVANDTTYNQRRAAYIQSCLAAPNGSKLVLQAYQNIPLDANLLNNKLNNIATGVTSDFDIIEMVRISFLNNGAYDAQILPVINSVPYWINYGDTVRNYWSENHMIMWMSSDWLLHERYGKAIDTSLVHRLKHYLQLKVDYGFYEFFSSVYGPYSFSGILNLADFAQDAEIKSLATQAAKRLLSNFLMLTNNKGVYFPAAGRNYPGKYDNPYDQNHNNLIYLLTGMGDAPTNASAAGAFLASSPLEVGDVSSTWVPTLNTVYHIGHTLQQGLVLNATQQHTDKVVFQWSSGAYFHPLVVQETAQLLVDSNMWDQVDFSLLASVSNFPPSSFPVLSTSLSCISESSVICGEDVAIFKSNAVTLSSIQDFWKGKVGFQQYPCVVNVGTTAVYPASGPVTPNWDDRNPNNQNIHLPYVEQHSNLVLVMYRPEITPALIGPGFEVKDVSLRWNDADFDEVVEDSLWLMGRQAEGYVAVRRSCLGEVDGVRYCPTPVNGGQTWVVMVGDSAMYGNFDTFKNIVHQSVFTEDWYYNAADTEMVYHAKIVMDTTTIEYSWGRDSILPLSVTEIAYGDFSIYPNPATDALTIKADLKGNYNVELYSVSGQLVYSYKGLVNQLQVPVNTLSEGLYAVKITAPNGKVHSQRVVVRR